jgi:hypothetical protein
MLKIKNLNLKIGKKYNTTPKDDFYVLYYISSLFLNLNL